MESLPKLLKHAERLGDRYTPPLVSRPIKHAYHYMRGTYPLSRAERSLQRKVRNPLTFNEKVIARMAQDRRPLLTTLADKLASREFVVSRVGAEYLAELYGTCGKDESFRPSRLGHNFVVKPSHASGAVVIVWDRAPVKPLPTNLRRVMWSPYLIHPKSLCWASLEALATKWLSHNYYWTSGQFPEWAYKDVEPQILFEELMLDHEGGLAPDYKFYMFSGQCQLIQFNRGRFSHHREDFYDAEWRKLDINWGIPNTAEWRARPTRLDEMLDIARTLSAGIDFLRVDLYQTSRGVRFGEFCTYPGAGADVLAPRSFDRYLGDRWEFPRRERS